MRRFLWSILVSAILNALAWVVLPAKYSSWLTPAQQPRERVTVAFSRVRLERRPSPAPTPLRTPSPLRTPTILRTPTMLRTPAAAAARTPAAAAARAPAEAPQAASMAPPQPATLALPHGWTKQDFGFLGTIDTTEWLDWKHQSAKWVPRVFLWKWKVKTGYMSRPSLQETIKQILASLHDEGAKIYASNSEHVCDGQRPGWYLSYTKTSDTPPIRFDETLYMSGEIFYRAMYLRAADQPEDSATRKALDTFCWP
jgi:hypothetical protein